MAVWGPGGAAGPGSWPPAPDPRGCGSTRGRAPGDPVPALAAPQQRPPLLGVPAPRPSPGPATTPGGGCPVRGLALPISSVLLGDEAETSVPARARLCAWHRTRWALCQALLSSQCRSRALAPLPAPGPHPARVAHGPALPGGLTAATFRGRRAGGPVRGIGINPSRSCPTRLPPYPRHPSQPGQWGAGGSSHTRVHTHGRSSCEPSSQVTGRV